MTTKTIDTETITDEMRDKFNEWFSGDSWNIDEPIKIIMESAPAVHDGGHPDDMAVDRFAIEMKEKLAKKRAQGRGGWEDKQLCPAYRLQQMLIEHLSKGDPVDIGNFAMMIWNRGEQVAAPSVQGERFQHLVAPWMQACFGAEISADKIERNHRFLEESLELVQACGCTKEEAITLVNYVYGRPAGETKQEVGGAMVTLAALCLAQDVDMHDCGVTELARVWTAIEQIRAKQAAKPKKSPLPQLAPSVQGEPVSYTSSEQLFIMSERDIPVQMWSANRKHDANIALYTTPQPRIPPELIAKIEALEYSEQHAEPCLHFAFEECKEKVLEIIKELAE